MQPPPGRADADLDGGNVGRANLDGSSPEPAFISGIERPSFGRRHRGRARVTLLSVRFPQAGKFSVTATPGARVRVISHGPSTRTRLLLGAEERILKVWPAKRGRAAAALRARLKKRGVARVWVRIEFAAADGTGSTRRERLALFDRGGSRHATPAS